MRIGLIIYGSLETLSGGYLYDRMLVEYLREHGDTLEVISLTGRGYASHLLHNFSSRLLHRLADLECEILLQDELNHPSLFILNRRLRDAVSYPLISIVHHLRSCEDNPLWLNPVYRSIESRYLSSLDGFICNSLATQKEVADLLNSERSELQNRTCLVANPGGDRLQPQVSEAEIRRRASQDGPLRILFTGNIISRKGLHVLLKALKRLPADRFLLNVVGDPDADPSYILSIRRLIEQDEMTDRVIFKGILSDSDLADCMRSSHLLVMPSFYEGFGIVYLEGMGFGLPAIATDCGGAREIIRHGVDGFLVPSGDDTVLAEHLTLLAEDRGLLLEMSLDALDNYRSRPTWDDSMKSIRNFLKDQLSEA